MTPKGTQSKKVSIVITEALMIMGIFYSCGSLGRAFTWAQQTLSGDGASVPGVLRLLLACDHLCRAIAAQHISLLHYAAQRVAVSSWPLLLVVLGMAGTCETLEHCYQNARKKYRQLVDHKAARSTSE